uniref:Uncharacterized protein n=1 Tax=Oryza brachyantha TaxID=4533 RepID=J3N1T7_ORYBR
MVARGKPLLGPDLLSSTVQPSPASLLAEAPSRCWQLRHVGIRRLRHSPEMGVWPGLLGYELEDECLDPLAADYYHEQLESDITGL